jgi:hypothetical protein
LIQADRQNGSGWNRQCGLRLAIGAVVFAELSGKRGNRGQGQEPQAKETPPTEKSSKTANSHG